MNPVLTYLYLGLLLLAGYAVAGWGFDRRRHWAEQVGLGFAAGLGAVGFLLFIASLTGIRPSRFILLSIAFPALVAVIVQLVRRGGDALPSPPAASKRDWFTPLGMIGLLAIVLAVSSVDARSHWAGYRDFDAFGIWLFKAKVLAIQPIRPIPDALRSPNFSYSHQDYPLGFPLVVAGLYSAAGQIGSVIADAVLLPIYIALLAVAYGGLRRMHRRAIALALAGVFIGAPAVTQNASVGVPESMLLLMLLAALVSAVRWIEGGTRFDLAIAGLFAAAAAFTKNEGLALLPVLGILLLIVTAARRSAKSAGDWLAFFAVAFVMIAPWIIFRRGLPKTHEDYGSKLTDPKLLAANLGRVWPTTHAVAKIMFMPSETGLIWYLLPAMAAVGWRAFRRPAVRVLWVFLAVQLLLYLATLVVTPWDPRELIPMITPRLLSQATPAVLLLVGLHLRETGWGRGRIAD
jgi:hypothetical protein